MKAFASMVLYSFLFAALQVHAQTNLSDFAGTYDGSFQGVGGQTITVKLELQSSTMIVPNPGGGQTEIPTLIGQLTAVMTEPMVLAVFDSAFLDSKGHLHLSKQVQDCHGDNTTCVQMDLLPNGELLTGMYVAPLLVTNITLMKTHPSNLADFAGSYTGTFRGKTGETMNVKMELQSSTIVVPTPSGGQTEVPTLIGQMSTVASNPIVIAIFQYAVVDSNQHLHLRTQFDDCRGGYEGCTELDLAISGDQLAGTYIAPYLTTDIKLQKTK